LVAGYLKDIYLSESQKEAEKAIKVFSEAFIKKYPKAVETVLKRKDSPVDLLRLSGCKLAAIRANYPIKSILMNSQKNHEFGNI
jgi:hypothetical protein